MKKTYSIIALTILTTLNLLSCSKAKTQEIEETKETSEIKYNNSDSTKDYDYIHLSPNLKDYFNRKGEILFEGRFKSAYSFNGKEYALVESNDGSSVIDKKGTLVFPFGKYLNPIILNDGFISVATESENYGVIDNKDNLIIPIKYDKITQTKHNNFIAETLDGKMCLYNSKGDLIIPEEYSYIDEISKDRFSFKDKNGKLGLIDTTGKILVDSIYEEILEESEGYICVKKDDKYGYINKDGQELIPFQYDDANSFYDNYARVKQGKKYGVINNKNEIVIPFNYSDIYAFESNYNDYLISDNYNSYNQILSKNKKSSQVFINDVAVASNNGKDFLINKDNVKISNEYDKIMLQSGAFIGNKSVNENNSVIIDFNGKEISKGYGFITAQPYGFLTAKENFEDQLSTLVRNDGKVIFEEKDIEIYLDSVSSGLIPVLFEDKAIILDKEGNSVLEFKNDSKKGNVKRVTILEPNLYKVIYEHNTIDLINDKKTIIKTFYY